MCVLAYYIKVIVKLYYFLYTLFNVYSSADDYVEMLNIPSRSTTITIREVGPPRNYLGKMLLAYLIIFLKNHSAFMLVVVIFHSAFMLVYYFIIFFSFYARVDYCVELYLTHLSTVPEGSRIIWSGGEVGRQRTIFGRNGLASLKALSSPLKTLLSPLSIEPPLY